MNKPKDWRELFLPPAAYQTEETLRLHRFFIATCFVTAIFAAGYCIMSVYMDGPLFAEAMAASIILFICMPLVLRFGLSLTILVNLFLSVIGVVAICLIYWEGGIRRANVAPWIMVLPAFAIMLQGVRQGIIWLIIGLCIIAFFSYFTFQGVIFPIRFDISKDPLFSILSMSGLVCLVTFIFFISERERKKSHQALQSQNITLDMLSKEKTKFLQIAAHDLRNPLISIQSLAERFSDPDLSDEEREICLNYIISSADRMSELIKNLLEIQVMDAGRMNINNQQVSLNNIVNSYVNHMSHLMEDRQAEIEVSLPEKELLITSDPARITQILDNYVSNAFKYSPEGSKVYIHLSEHEKYIELSVRDEGPGISEKDMDKLFKQFSTVSSVPRSGEHATGLGLAIVKKLSDALGAEVGCQSEKGKGCTFYVRFQKA
jgi:signal transduction histidine kinase